MGLLGKKVMIVGEGISGKGAYEALKPVAAPFFYSADLDFGKTPPDLIVISPGVANHPAIDFAKTHNISVISELELGYLLCSGRLAAVTGTNGKTTVTRLLGEILKKEYAVEICGNIGVPFSLSASKGQDITVVEASSFQLERCFEFRPDVAIITNLTPDHLDRHGTMDEYILAKLRISQNQKPDDFLILPYELKDLASKIKGRPTIIFSGRELRAEDGGVYFFDELIMPIAEIPLLGGHNITNVVQAAGAARLLGAPACAIRQAVMEFLPESHRLEPVGVVKGKHWFDDSKATNIGACLAACKSTEGDTALILGGSDKGYGYEPLFEALPAHIKEIYITGAIKDKLAEAAAKISGEYKIIECQNLDEAVQKAAESSVLNVLLSPAAASFDCFKDYKERGRAFVAAIKNLFSGE